MTDSWNSWVEKHDRKRQALRAKMVCEIEQRDDLLDLKLTCEDWDWFYGGSRAMAEFFRYGTISRPGILLAEAEKCLSKNKQGDREARRLSVLRDFAKTHNDKSKALKLVRKHCLAAFRAGATDMDIAAAAQSFRQDAEAG